MHGIMCVQGIGMDDKHAHILVARKESEVLSNTIWISAKQGLYRQPSNTNTTFLELPDPPIGQISHRGPRGGGGQAVQSSEAPVLRYKCSPR
jgi:hypothetical protein